MEQYLNAKVKRYIQKRLFSNIHKTKTILGLAGTHPEKYLEVLPYHKQVVLVDFNPISPLVRRNSIVGEFDLLSHQPTNYSPVTLVDCDFCKSYKSCGEDLLYIYNKMKKSLVRNKWIAFTFSLRNAGTKETLAWLGTNFPELRKHINNTPINKNLSILQPRQYIHEYSSMLFGYRDSGACMISGLIKVT